MTALARGLDDEGRAKSPTARARLRLAAPARAARPDRRRSGLRAAVGDRRDAPPRRIAARAGAEAGGGKGGPVGGARGQVSRSRPLPDARGRHRGQRRAPHAAEMRNPRRSGGLPAAPVRPRPSRLYRALRWRRRAGRCAGDWSRRACGSSACRARRSTPISSSGEWRGKAGGYAIQGLAGAFVVRLVGSYTNVVGLPLAETCALLAGEGYYAHRQWVPNLLK